MQAFELSQLINEARKTTDSYLEFIRHPSLSLGLYMLPAGAPDLQQPHTEDEVYYIITGQGAIQAATENHPVEPGSIIFVPARAEHHFHSITQDLTILVLFAPAEYTHVGAIETSG